MKEHCHSIFYPDDDLRMDKLLPLFPPAILLEDIPISEEGSRVVTESRLAIRYVMDGRDDRLMGVIGPCSIQDVRAALEYARKLKLEADRLKEDLLVVMRVYFEKPRTTVGWKGLINDPRLDDACIGWNDTVQVLDDLARAMRTRRQNHVGPELKLARDALDQEVAKRAQLGI